MYLYLQNNLQILRISMNYVNILTLNDYKIYCHSLLSVFIKRYLLAKNIMRNLVLNFQGF